MAQNKDLVADPKTLLEENLSEKKSVESARRLSSSGKRTKKPPVCYFVAGWSVLGMDIFIEHSARTFPRV